MNKVASYILSTYSFIFTNSLDSVLQAGYESDDAIPIPSFEESLLIDLCTEAQKIVEVEKNLLEIDGDTIVVGDIHGSLHDLLRIIKFTQEKRSKVLFLGDYVDRGMFSLECITILLALKIMYPDTFFLIRGNHEFDCLCSQYGFKDEIINYHNPKIPKKAVDRSKLLSNLDQLYINEDENYEFDEFYANYQNENCYKYSEALYNAFINVFNYLPIGAIVNKETFCIHGGLSPKLDLIDNINEIHRPIKDFDESGLLSDLVWSDPSYSPNFPFVANSRGRGYFFNIEAINNFLKKNSIKRIIRAHECVEGGTFKNFGNKLMTVFSASSYDKIINNKSGIIQLFAEESKFKITTFVQLPRLQKSEAIYCKVQPLSQNDDNTIFNHSCFSFLHPTLYSSKLSASRTKQCRHSTNNVSQIHSYNGKPVKLFRPKFTTNRRQSFHIMMDRPQILSSTPTNSDNEDCGNDKLKRCSNSQRLPEKLFSFSDSIFVSDE